MLKNCPVCHEAFTEKSPASIITCKEGHVLCWNCLQSLWDGSNEVDYEQCWLMGKNCLPSRRHRLCPVCLTAFHIRNNDLENILKLPNDLKDIEVLLILRGETRQNILLSASKLKQMGNQKIAELNGLIKDINGVTKKSRIARIGTSSLGIVGGILMITGAVLAVPTMGASTPLLIAGGVMTGGAASGTLGSSITEFVKNRKITQEAYNSWKELQDEFEEFLYLNHEFSIQNAALVVKHQEVLRGATSSAKLTGHVMGLMNVASHVVKTSTVSGMSSLGSMVGKSVAVLGLIASSLSVIVDSILVVWNSMELYKNTPSEYAPKIEMIIEAIRFHVIREAESAQNRLKEVDESFFEDMLKLQKQMVNTGDTLPEKEEVLKLQKQMVNTGDTLPEKEGELKLQKQMVNTGDTLPEKEGELKLQKQMVNTGDTLPEKEEELKLQKQTINTGDTLPEKEEELKLQKQMVNTGDTLPEKEGELKLQKQTINTSDTLPEKEGEQ